ncbi:MAG: hypothetical protein ACYCUZ_03455 [Cuniculiplasma sp.]
MKSLYLVEGKHDLDFLYLSLSQNYSIESSKIKLYCNVGIKTVKATNESLLIRGLMGEYSKYDALIKAEEGKQNLFSLLGKICIPTVQNNQFLNLTTVFDHDGNESSSDFKTIFDKVSRTHPQLNFEPIFDRKISDCHNIEVGHTVSYSVLKISGKKKIELNKINFFCFSDSLETFIEKKFGKNIPINDGIMKLCKCLKGIDFLPGLNPFRH